MKLRKWHKKMDSNILRKLHGRKAILYLILEEKSKNVEDVMIFSNGEPRSLKLDAKKKSSNSK